MQLFNDYFPDSGIPELEKIQAEYKNIITNLNNGNISEIENNTIANLDPDFEMSGVIDKLILAIRGIRNYGEDCIDDKQLLRVDSLEQFDRKKHGRNHCFREAFDLMRCDYYRNLAYIEGTDTKFSIIRDGLYAFNENFNALFKWLVKEVKCKHFIHAWECWSAYKDFSFNNGYTRPWDKEEPPAYKKKLDQLESDMLDAFDELSEIPVITNSFATPSISTIVGKAEELFKEGSSFHTPTPEDRLLPALDILDCYFRFACHEHEFGLLSNRYFIKILRSITTIDKFDIFKDDIDGYDAAWAKIISSSNIFFRDLRDKIPAPEIDNMLIWLNEHRKLVRQRTDSNVFCRISSECLIGLFEGCREISHAIYPAKYCDEIVELYDGKDYYYYERFEFIELAEKPNPAKIIENKPNKPSSDETPITKKDLEESLANHSDQILDAVLISSQNLQSGINSIKDNVNKNTIKENAILFEVSSGKHGKPLPDGRKVGELRKTMTDFGYNLVINSQYNTSQAAEIIIAIFTGKEGAYSKDEKDALRKQIDRLLKDNGIKA